MLAKLYTVADACAAINRFTLRKIKQSQWLSNCMTFYFCYLIFWKVFGDHKLAAVHTHTHTRTCSTSANTAYTLLSELSTGSARTAPLGHMRKRRKEKYPFFSTIIRNRINFAVFHPQKRLVKFNFHKVFLRVCGSKAWKRGEKKEQLWNIAAGRSINLRVYGSVIHAGNHSKGYKYCRGRGNLGVFTKNVNLINVFSFSLSPSSHTG